ncbi:SigE family RNA polymerase sigma factor [Allorhizocola rhizosphaerae]|uniref:SigE family RNA polymerase sigma factor n=1 Tax=Allorhizocola rhizosphaerae TaxID=1872709 RepID=UPI000E3E21D7|nr:SigE family RNA polymerase sigma factor [Allorhizocola rhizosphaerae]
MTDQSFEEFVAASMPTLSRYAHALTGVPDRADDLLQDTYVSVARSWSRVDAQASPLAYARKAMLNTYLNMWRALRRGGYTVPYDDDDEGRAARDDYGRVDERDVISRALRRLPRDQRAVLVLGFLDDLSDEQIAAVLDRRPATVRSLRHRALQTLRKRHCLEASYV